VVQRIKSLYRERARLTGLCLTRGRADQLSVRALEFLRRLFLSVQSVEVFQAAPAGLKWRHPVGIVLDHDSLPTGSHLFLG